jgi:hypothetical protein
MEPAIQKARCAHRDRVNAGLDKAATFHFTLADIGAARRVNESGAGVVETE